MPRFEVHIPAADTAGFNVTFRVDADNWMAALKTGMQKLGEQGATVHNILVDIQDDNSVHVTDSASGRVFRIRELTDAEAAQAQVKRTPSQPPTRITDPFTRPPSATPTLALENTPAATPRPAPEPPTVPARAPLEPAPSAATQPHDAADLQALADAREAAARSQMAPQAVTLVEAPAPAVPATLPPAPAAPPVAARAESQPPHKRRHKPSEADSVVELEAPTRPVVGHIGRPAAKNRKDEIEDLLAEVFDRVQDVYGKPNEEAALYFLLDLALEKIPAESGSVFFADPATGDLSFRAVRGPRAQELLQAKLVIPSGTGIVGFCAVEGVSVALSDVEKDPRFFSAVAERVNYVPKSMLCAPMMTHGRSFGALQILNKRDNSSFNEVEVGLAAYVAHQAALYLNSR